MRKGLSAPEPPNDLARLAAIVEFSDDAIISKDLSGVITTWNRGAQRLFGYSAEEVIGKSVNLLIPPANLKEEAHILDRVRRGERVEYYETTRLAKDGRLLEVSLSISPIRDGAGRVVGASKIARNIIERKVMEREVWQGRVKLRAILDTAIDSIISIDARGLILAVNPATERMFRYTPSELLGQNVKILMPAPYREEHDNYLSRYKRTSEKRIIGVGREVQARRKDGSVFAIDLAVSEVEPGKLFTGIIRDISERKIAEMKLRESDRMASIGTLAAGLGHDMNNVLLPVRARLSALVSEGQQGKLSKTASTDVLEIIKSVAYLQQLADGLHFLAMDPEAEDTAAPPTDVAAWWFQTGALISKAVPKHVRVTASFPAGLPRVAAAAHGLTQAVLNLVVNAGEAIPPDRKRPQGSVRIWAAVTTDAKHVKLGVTDNGRGMAEEVRRRARDMFFTTKSRGLGTGLGMPLICKFAEGAGGSVEIESRVGHGTTVAMLLPVVGKEKHRTEVPRAVVSLADGRAAAMIRHVLVAIGVRAELGSDPAHADIWVIDPTTTDLSKARVWREAHPNSRLLLFGAPGRGSSSEWACLNPVTIEDRNDLGAIRAAVGRVVEAG